MAKWQVNREQYRGRRGEMSFIFGVICLLLLLFMEVSSSSDVPFFLQLTCYSQSCGKAMVGGRRGGPGS
eukprot:206501-Amphidinium_carterae.1